VNETYLGMIAGLKVTLEDELATGAVRRERAAPLRQALAALEDVLTKSDRGEMDDVQAISRVLGLIGAMTPLVVDPGPDGRVVGLDGYRARIDRYAGSMKAALGMETARAKPGSATADALAAMQNNLTRFQVGVADVADDDAMAHLEASLLRPTARARHELAGARHALLAQPLWETAAVLPTVDTVAYGGDPDLRLTLETALAGRGLRLSADDHLLAPGQARWDTLRRCHVAVLDLRGASDITGLARRDPARAREVAASAYELGLAFALGIPVVLACGVDELLPFDVDVTPVRLDGGTGDVARLRDAVDLAFYEQQRPSGGNAIAETVAFLDGLTDGHPYRAAFEQMGWLDRQLADDPARFVAVAEQLLQRLPSWRLLRPAWPGSYPEPGVKRCFHVMPFGPDWADGAFRTARDVCRSRRVSIEYQRGDLSREGRINRAIWDDLCRATVVLVDVTGANLNVFIEWGMAHAIGRRTVAVRQPGPLDIRPPHVQKLRVLPYRTRRELRRILTEHLPEA
jgi:hypothetical protein